MRVTNYKPADAGKPKVKRGKKTAKAKANGPGEGPKSTLMTIHIIKGDIARMVDEAESALIMVDYAAPIMVRAGMLEHVPPQLNQGDSRGAEDGRGYRH
jgi:hypothetical protein